MDEAADQIDSLKRTIKKLYKNPEFQEPAFDMLDGASSVLRMNAKRYTILAIIAIQHSIENLEYFKDEVGDDEELKQARSDAIDALEEIGRIIERCLMSNGEIEAYYTAFADSVRCELASEN